MDPVAAYVACFLSSSLGSADACGAPPWRELARQGYQSALLCATVAGVTDQEAARLCAADRACDRVAVHRSGRLMFFCAHATPVS